MARCGLVLALRWLTLLPAAAIPQADLHSPERRETIRREFERIEALPQPEQEKEIPRVYREMSPHDFIFRFCGEQPAMIVRPGKPIRFAIMYHRCTELLAAHVRVVTRLVREDLRSGDTPRIEHAVGVVKCLRLQEFYDDVVAAFRLDAVEQRAAEALRDLDDPRAIRVLIEKHPDDPLRHFESLRHLCKQRPADPALLKHLRSENATTRRRAACALSESGDPRLAAEVARLATDPDPEVRKKAARMGRFIAAGDLGPARSALLKLLADKDVNVRVAAARRLAVAKDQACARTLLTLLGEDNIDELVHVQVWKAVHDLAGTQFGYYHGSDGWRPTTERNKAALRRFAIWVESIEGPEA